MNIRWRKWFYGLGSAVIGGGSGAVVSGITAMGFAPDKFNLADVNGAMRLLGLMATNFFFSGILSMFFYLKQSPLPAEPTGDSDPEAFKRSENTPKDE
jgi:hypothetical protein